MELNHLNALVSTELTDQPTGSGEDYSCKSDWKFHQIVYLANLFKGTLAIEPLSATDLELSLLNPEYETLCLSLLWKLLMKKAVFKPNAKITDTDSKDKLKLLLCKKLIYFYKIYSRCLIKKYKAPFTEELINHDLLSFDETEFFNIMKAKDYYKEIEFELDVKKLMVLNLFRSLKGKNPVINYSLNQIAYEEKPAEKKNLGNKIQIAINNDDQEKDWEIKSVKSQSSASKSSLSENDADIDYNNNSNYLINNSFKVINVNIKDDSEDLLSFADFKLKDKVEVLYFFFKYSIEFSGRQNLYRHELSANSHPAEDSASVIALKPVIFGKDVASSIYFTLPSNKSCVILKKKKESEGSFEVAVKSYAEIEQFISSLEKKRNEDLHKVTIQLESKKKKGNKGKSANNGIIDFTDLTCESDLITGLKDYLLTFKEFEEEEKRKLANFNKKVFISKNQGNNKEYVLMNFTNHVTTRRQLHQLTENNGPTKSSNKHMARELTSEEIKLIKIEQQKEERARRLLERSKQLEKDKARLTGRKRKYKNYDENSEGSNEGYSVYDEESSKRNGSNISQEEIELEVPLTKNGQANASYKINYAIRDDQDELEDNIKMNEHEDQEIGLEATNNEIQMDCNLIYRYELNQIELEGSWGMSSSEVAEKVSYLFIKSNEKHRVLLKNSMISPSANEALDNPRSTNEEADGLPKKKELIFYTSKDLENMFPLDICAANLIEVLLINNQFLTNEALKFLSNEYSGYFVYFSKTIEDRFTLQMTLNDSLVSIEGQGINNLGRFRLRGYMSLYRNKDELLRNNNLNDSCVKLGKMKLTKTYVVFNPNENNRVIKSYTHRKREVTQLISYGQDEEIDDGFIQDDENFEF